MEIETKLDEQALVGVLINNRVIYNVLDNDVEFLNTGLSIINNIKSNKNKFISNVFESQSYNSIKYIYDDKMIFSELYNTDNENIDTFESVMRLMQNENDYSYFYILDTESNQLLIKIPELVELHALDYRNSKDVRDYINTIK